MFYQLSEEYFWNYCVVLPIISAIGIIGNTVNLIVLQRGNFKGFMFTYMQLLSLTDIGYLLFTVQACIFTDLGYFITKDGITSSSYALIFYVWVCLTPLWNTFGSGSDLVVVCMTISRFRILRDIDKINLCEWSRKKYHVKGVVTGCLVLSFLLHMPYFFQVQVIPCPPEEEDPSKQALQNNQDDCWTHETSDITQSQLWAIYGYIYQVIIKICPLVLIFSLNIAMVFKLRRIWKQRRKLQARTRKREEERKRLQVEREKRRRAEERYAGPGKEISIVTNTARQMMSMSNTLTVPGIVSCDGTSPLNSEEESGITSRRPSLVSTMDNSSSLFGKEAKPKAKGKRKKIALFGMPSKESRKELKMSILLIVMAVSHGLLTTPGNISYFFYTNLPDQWEHFEDRSLFKSIANSLNALKYSKNFFLYCITNPDIRKATIDLFRTFFEYFQCRGKTATITGKSVTG